MKICYWYHFDLGKNCSKSFPSSLILWRKRIRSVYVPFAADHNTTLAFDQCQRFHSSCLLNWIEFILFFSYSKIVVYFIPFNIWVKSATSDFAFISSVLVAFKLFSKLIEVADSMIKMKTNSYNFGRIILRKTCTSQFFSQIFFDYFTIVTRRFVYVEWKFKFLLYTKLKYLFCRTVWFCRH